LEWPFPPTCPDDIYNLCRESSNRQTMNIFYLFGCLAWSLWLIRNEFVFQNLVISSLNVGLFRAISFLQKWTMLSKETERQWIDMMIQRLSLRLSSLRPDI
jgi:hypothetical protein